MYKALVIEDDLISRKIIQRTLAKLGYSTIAASDPLIALSILPDNEDIRLIVTDHQMPNMTGSDFIMQLKKNLHWSSIPLIMISGQISLTDIHHLLGAGISYFMPKPLNINDFTTYVSRLEEERNVIDMNISEGLRQ